MGGKILLNMLPVVLNGSGIQSSLIYLVIILIIFPVGKRCRSGSQLVVYIAAQIVLGIGECFQIIGHTACGYGGRIIILI